MARKYSHSQLQVYMDCPLKYKNYYLKKQRLRKRPGYFVLGEAIGNYIAIYYNTKDPELAARQVKIVYDKVDRTLLNKEEIHKLEIDRNIALGISEAYPKTYRQDFDQYKSFLTEQQFTLKVGDKDEYTGYIDVLIQDATGAWWVLETKTATAPDASYFERVQIDSQVAGYMYGAKEILGEFPNGVIYNVIKKPSIRLRKGESLAAFQRRIYLEYTTLASEKGYFTRHELMIPERTLTNWWKNVNHVAKEVTNKVALGKEGVWPMNTGHCTGKFGACMYLPACTSGSFNKIVFAKG